MPATMTTIDNSGRGNCMYFSYAISLMYVLRAKQDQNATKRIFDKLKLSPEKIKQLNDLLSSKRVAEFSKDEINKIIEPYLGNAVREFAADSVEIEFTKNPQGSSLFTVMNYILESRIRLMLLTKRQNDLVQHIPLNSDPQRNYLDAEIFKTPGINKEIDTYLESVIDSIIKEAGEKCSARHSDADNRNILDNIIREKTVNFFLKDQQANLKRYTNHLKTPGVWGTEETLLTLHRAIQGEHLNSQLNNFVYDDNIPLHIYENGEAPHYQRSVPQIVLNNIGNYHWVSFIPDTILKKEVSEFNEEDKICEITFGIYRGSLVPMVPSHNVELMNYLSSEGFTVLTKPGSDFAMINIDNDLASDVWKNFFEHIDKINKNSKDSYFFTLSQATIKKSCEWEQCMTQEAKASLEAVFSTKLNGQRQSTKHEPISPLPSVVSDEENLEFDCKTVATANTSRLNRQKMEERGEIRSNLDNILGNLQKNVGKIDKHKCTEAFLSANELLENLDRLKEKYFPSNQEAILLISQENFIIECKNEIEKVKPILEKDLSWGDYLTNLLKEIANAVLFGVTLGCCKKFFEPTRSTSIVHVEELETKLDNLIQNKP